MQGMALHAAVLGALSKAETTEADANEKKAQAEEAFKGAGDAAFEVQRKSVESAKKTLDAANGRQDKRIADVKQVVADAMKDLNDDKAQARKNLGVELPDYLAQAQAVGGSVRL